MSENDTQEFQLFISHSNEDSSFVRKLKIDLKQHFLVWVDDDTDCLKPGDSLVEKIDAALNEMTHFLIVCSPNSMKSEWVQKELEAALTLLKRRGIVSIIPVKYKRCRMPKDLARFVYVDFSEIIFHSELNDFLCAGNEEREKYGEQLATTIKAIGQSAPKSLKVVEPGKRKENQFDIYLRLVGYRSGTKSTRAREVAQVKGSNKPGRVKPIVLPLQMQDCGLRIGTSLLCKYDGRKASGHFAGFGWDHRRITLPIELRKKIEIRNLTLYRVKANLSEGRIAFFDV